METCRSAFENWAKSQEYSVKRDKAISSIYDMAKVNAMYESWCAAWIYKGNGNAQQQVQDDICPFCGPDCKREHD